MTDNIVIKVFKDNSEKVILDNNKECIALYSDNWNDYDFMTLFTVAYFDKSGNKLNLGFLKLGHKGMNNRYPDNGQNEISSYLHPNIENEISFDDDYFSLAQDSDFYTRLTAQGDDTLLRRVLTSLKELTIQTSDFIESIDAEPVLNTSLLRNDFPECIYQLTKIKNEFLSNSNFSNQTYTDTYNFITSPSFVKTLDNRLEKNLEDDLLKITKSHISQFFLVQVVVNYFKKFPDLMDEDDKPKYLDAFKYKFMDRAQLVSEINYLQGEKGDIYDEFKKISQN